MTDKRSQVSRLMVILIMALLCVFLGLALFFTISLLAKVEDTFGPPTDLGVPQRISYTFGLLRYEDDLLTPVDFSLAEEYKFEIGAGEAIPSIVNRLQAKGVIRNATAMQTYLIYSGLDTTIQAGVYKIPPGLNAVQIAQLFQDATPATISFGVWPGWRMEEIAATLPSSGLAITPQEFIQTANLPATRAEYSWAEAATVEGYFLPGSYEIERDANVFDLLEVLLGAFDEQISLEMRAGFGAQGLSLQEAVILASIVEREAVIPEEQPVIASVFLNRLAVGMPLESDPTAQYAIGYVAEQNTWWKNPLLAADLQVHSPYNTYVVSGLPPGAICNPSWGALQAVAAPVSSGYYFFRARCDGSGYHHFSTTYEEHLQFACP
ncbi:MAG: endolytic transglycosylase MltG [Anaerolineaceae bacterium]|nr:endolytic transglycosylase MltG [Anaerolineaceae bacterium]